MAVECKLLVRLAADNYILTALIKAIKVYSFQQIVILYKTFYLYRHFLLFVLWVILDITDFLNPRQAEITLVKT